MDLYEHQGKDLFAAHGIPLAERGVAETPSEARAIAERLGGKVAVKAQVQVGGRGKGGGVVLTRSTEEAESAAARILGEGFGGTPVTRVLVERLADIADQLYAAITLDRTKKCYVAMVSAKGGIDIEEIAREEPQAIRRSAIDPMLGMRGFQARFLVGHLPGAAREGLAELAFGHRDRVRLAGAVEDARHEAVPTKPPSLAGACLLARVYLEPDPFAGHTGRRV